MFSRQSQHHTLAFGPEEETVDTNPAIVQSRKVVSFCIKSLDEPTSGLLISECQTMIVIIVLMTTIDDRDEQTVS